MKTGSVYRNLFFVLLLISVLNCERNRFDFPYVPVNLNISLTFLDSEIEQGGHKFMYDNEGVNGLIIFRNFNDQYFVYDRSCTYEPDFSCSVGNDTTSNFHLNCTCCKSQYFLDPSDEAGEAYVTRGPAKYNLVRYNSFANGGFLSVVN